MQLTYKTIEITTKEVEHIVNVHNKDVFYKGMVMFDYLLEALEQYPVMATSNPIVDNWEQTLGETQGGLSYDISAITVISVNTSRLTLKVDWLKDNFNIMIFDLSKTY